MKARGFRWGITEEKASLLLYSFFLACVFLLMRGYQFNSSDQAEHLPQVYKLMDPQLYKGDYFMDANAHTFTVRFFYVWLVYGLSFVMPVSAVCFVLCILCISLSVYSFVRITGFFTESLIAVLLAPILIFFIFYNFTLGGINLQSSSFICSSIGSSMAAYGILCYFRGNLRLMAVVLGIASLFQLMDAAQVFVLFFLLHLFERKKHSWLETAQIAGLYIAFSAPMFVPMFYKQFIHETNVNSYLYYHILYHFRNPHHFLPSHFPMEDYLKTILLLGAGVWASFYLKGRNISTVYKLFIIIVLGMTIYYFALQKFEFYAAGKLQWFKTSMWMGAFNSIFISAFLSGLIGEKREKMISIKTIKYLSSASACIILILILNTKYIPIKKMQGRYQAGNYKKSELTEMHEWIRLNTHKGTLILSFPSDDSFSCEAQRPAPIGFKAVIHETFFMIPWYEKFRKNYGVDLKAAEAGDVLQQADRYYEHQRNTDDSKIVYRLDRISKCKFVSSLDPVVYKHGDFILSKYADSGQ